MSLYTSIPLQAISRRRARVLVRFFALKHARAKDLPPRPLTKDAEDLIASYAWQDDLSSLSATIRNAVIMAEGPEVGTEVIRLPEARSIGTGANEWDQVEVAFRTLMGQSLAELERAHILLTLECCCGNRILAAEVLGISVRTLRNKLKKFAQDGLPIAGPGAASKHHRSRAEQHELSI